MATTSLALTLNSESNGPRTTTRGRILVIEDDFSLQDDLGRLFGSEGYEVEIAAEGLPALEILRKRPPSVLIFRLRSPRSSAYDFCRQIVRLAPRMPFLILSPNSDIVNKIVLLEIGADDYLTMPFTSEELVARLRALMRRASWGGREPNYIFEDVTVDFSTMDVTRCGEKVPLTAKEFKTLEFMTKHAHRVLSRDELLNEVWGYENYPCTRTVDNHILKLRQKLESNPSDPSHFLTVHSVGYKFVP